MKKKLLAIFLVAFMLICAGCFGDPVKSDLEDYLKFEMSVEQESQDFSLDFMGNAYGATNKEEVLKIFKDGTEKLTALVNKQKSYKPKTKEVQDIHDKGIKVLDNSVDTLNELTKLMNESNPSKEKLNSIMKGQQDTIKLMKEYRNDINALAEQKKVEVKLNFK